LLILLIHLSIVIVFTFRILLRDDLVPTSRLAWFIVVTILPYFGIILYFLFGEVNLGQAANRRRSLIFSTIRKVARDAMGTKAEAEKLIDPHYLPAFQYAASINAFHAVAGNTADLMADADQARARLIADIDEATDYVHVLYYIWLDDQTGNDLAQALIRAVKRGVTCRAIADGMGSRALIHAQLWKDMDAAGVKLAIALPFKNIIHTLITSRVDLRNHRKISVIDGKITYCGSQNCADQEFRVKPKFAPWVDLLVRFKGPIVAQNQLLFASDWIQATDENLDAFTWEAQAQVGGFPAQVIGDGPTERTGATPHLFSALLHSARSEVTLSTPYFVPDATLLEALCATAYRGVQVNLIFPRKNDSWIVAAASRSYYKKLLASGVRIFEFEGGLLHAKSLTMDGKISLIGSSNLDLRSFDLNYENNILLQDETLTADIRNRQSTYIAKSEEICMSAVQDWSYHNRIWNNVIATIGPIL
jgi:cardiolipin synthase